MEIRTEGRNKRVSTIPEEQYFTPNLKEGRADRKLSWGMSDVHTTRRVVQFVKHSW
jgi:hypothetical protein